MKVKGHQFNYNEYTVWIKELVAERKTSGESQSEALIGFTVLNQKRMQRLDKTIELNHALKEKLSRLIGKQVWYVLAEPWCGDCAQNVPVIGKMAAYAEDKIDLRIILRDENPEWMEKYHTNGSKSVPKLIAFNTDGNELFTWGARPKEAQELLLSWKKNPNGRTWDDFEKELYTWYAKDKIQTIQNEFYELL